MVIRASLTIWLFLIALSGQAYAQQTPPATPAAGDPAAPPPPAANAEPPAPAPAGDQPPAANETPAPVPADPKTGLPLTQDELRQKEIDKFDPMKREVNPLAPELNAPATDTEQPEKGTNPDRKQDPLPGSIAATKAAQAPITRSSAGGGGSADTSTSGVGDYTGPAVLSRSYTLSRPMISRQIRWGGTVGVNFGWNSGQAPGATDGITSYQSTSSQSAGVNWSLSGRHLWKRDQIGLSYASGYSEYGNGNLSGGNSSFNLDYSHVVSRRMSLSVTESFQDLSQNYSVENPTLQPGNSLANINLATSPDTQLLNSHVVQSQTQASMTFRQSSRLSYNMSGGYFIIGRTEGTGMKGNQASGDVNYRWTRKATVGGYYSFTSYRYSHNVATTDSNGVGAIFSYAINAGMQLQTRFGATRMENLGYEVVGLPPELAVLLGQRSVIINAYTKRSTSDISVNLVKDFRRTRTANLSYVHGQTPGNGILLNSIQQSISAGASASFLRRRLPLSAGVTYSTLTATSQDTIGTYKSQSFYLSTSRPLGHGMNSSLSFNYSRYQVGGTALSEDSFHVSIGVVWGIPESFFPF